jgi:hypothetical protein
MRKALCGGLLGAASALAVLAPAAAAVTPWTPEGPGSPGTSFTVPAPVFCSFPVTITVISNQEKQRTITLGPPAPAGTTQTDVRGELILSFTNQNTGATVTRNVSGPTDTVAYPDGSGVETGSGNNWWTFGPNSQQNTGEPGVFLSSGPFVLQFSGNVVNSFQAQHQTDLCALLGS